jgi:hypothetical protein
MKLCCSCMNLYIQHFSKLTEVGVLEWCTLTEEENQSIWDSV